MPEAWLTENQKIRKLRVNGITVKLRIPPSHPVVKGVVKGLKTVDDPLRSITSITVLPNTKPHPSNSNLSIVGTCFCDDSGRSRIEIYAGSIGQTAHDQQTSAITTVRHEAGHARS